METVTVRMARGDRNQPWGFGVTEAENRDVVIVNIVGGSLAERAGLRHGDIVFELEGLRDLDINAVDRLLVTSREKIELIVHRNSAGQARIWRPEITENTDMRAVFSGNPPPVEQRPYKVSLEHHSETRAPQGFNTAAAPFDADPRVKHLQYNSPMGLYSQQNVEESYRQQTASLSGQSAQHSSGNSQPGYMQSETLRLIKEQDNRGPALGGGPAAPSLSSHPNPSGLPICFVCTRPILGMMAQAGGHTIHGDCLSCATCGNSLRNVGHHFIDNKFYCEIHGRQKKGLAPITLDPNLVVRSSPSAGQPVRKEEGTRGSYQPEILSRQPISPGNHSSHHQNSHSQINVHVSNPRTQGTISPGNRGVPLNPNYGGTGSNYSSSYGGQDSHGGHSLPQQQQRPVSPRPTITVAPPPPSNPPPGTNIPPSSSERPTSSLSIVSNQDSRIPNSVRDAVSPRRAARAPRPWPPPETGVKNRYWQIDPAGAAKREKEPEPFSLQELIQKDEKSTSHSSSPKNRNRRHSKIDPLDVKKGFQKLEKKSEPEELSQKPPQSYIVPPSALKREEPPRGSSTPQQFGDIFPLGVYGFAPIPQEDLEEPKKPPEINNGIHWTVITGPKSPTRTPPPNVTQIRIDQTVKPEPQRPNELPKTLLHVEPVRVDSSTSPIPVIKFERQKSLEKPPPHPMVTSSKPRFPCTSSPIPFQPPTISERPPSPPIIRLPSRSPIPPSSELGEMALIGVNTAPKPFGTLQGSPKKIAKPLKKVDFSKTEFIPSPVWEGSEVVDESDMLTVTSRASDEDSNTFDNPRVSYDADESITTNGEEEEELMDEQERWMKEELELAMKEELEMKMLEQKWEKVETRQEMQEKWEKQPRQGLQLEQKWQEDRPRQKIDQKWEDDQRQELQLEQKWEKEQNRSQEWEEQHEIQETKEKERIIEDEEQSERDLAMVAALHERLSGLMEMEDSDRQRAIECIERHQKSLEEQQEQLASLLQSAIVYLRQMEPEAKSREDLKPPTPPPRGSSIVKTDSLNEALEELDAIKLSAGEKLSRQLEKKVQSGGQQQAFSRSTFEKTTTTSGGPQSVGGGNKSNGVVGQRGGAATHNTASFGGRIPYCEACKQQIKGAFVLATGLAWCPEHFVCSNRSCGRRLLECGFVEEAGQKYCEGCFETHIAPRCAKCAKPITSDCLNALHKKWHPTCFTCAHCHKPFGNSAFYLENGQPYCEYDWNQLFTTKCISCKYPIEAGDRWVEALGSAFHSNCFNCTRCHTNLEGESFYAKNGQPFCKLHA